MGRKKTTQKPTVDGGTLYLLPAVNLTPELAEAWFDTTHDGMFGLDGFLDAIPTDENEYPSIRHKFSCDLFAMTSAARIAIRDGVTVSIVVAEDSRQHLADLRRVVLGVILDPDPDVPERADAFGCAPESTHRAWEVLRDEFVRAFKEAEEQTDPFPWFQAMNESRGRVVKALDQLLRFCSLHEALEDDWEDETDARVRAAKELVAQYEPDRRSGTWLPRLFSDEAELQKGGE